VTNVAGILIEMGLIDLLASFRNIDGSLEHDYMHINGQVMQAGRQLTYRHTIKSASKQGDNEAAFTASRQLSETSPINN
jgi:hypothetical protein